MPTIKCAKCGGDTNTAIADHIHNKNGEADACYAKWENGRWVKGCSYNEADDFIKKYVDVMVHDGK
jgi:predicted metal-binding protein